MRGKAVTQEDFIQRLAEVNPDITLISDFKNMKAPITVRHICGAEWSTRGNNALVRGCHLCAVRDRGPLVSKDVAIQRLNKSQPEFKYVSGFTSVKDTAKFKHSCGHTFTAKFCFVESGNTGCPKCNDRTVSVTEIRRRLQTAGRDVKYVSGYTAIKDKATFKHSCGHEWSAQVSSVLSGKGCPVCRNKLKWSEPLQCYLRGYEPQALQWILDNKLARTKDILGDSKLMPRIQYVLDSVNHTYTPDFYIPRQKRIVEVKSLSTAGLGRAFFDRKSTTLFKRLKAKRLACIELGFQFTLIVMNGKGERISLPKDWYAKNPKSLGSTCSTTGCCAPEAATDRLRVY